ncbi:hypothetical protein 10S11_59 [uncultured Caudovirales phage]|uniref:DUF3153 domain-containing protein n=1 Tax=uncultured Caudovirales phage TaxID=2100421 RepID=A0A2H4J8B5_9CAUD|nr:hypothetical protein 10S11_59 [uncultured Caudovirales phage]
MKTSKRIRIYVFICIMCLSLCGCGNIKINSNTQINEDESGKVQFQIIYDDFIASLLEKNKLTSDMDNIDKLRKKGIVFNNYSKDDMHIEEFSYEFKNLNQLEQQLNNTNFITMTHLKKKGITKNTYTVNLKCNASIIDELKKDKTLENEANTTDDMAYSYLKNIEFSNYISLPGTVIKSNATSELNSNIKTWTYKLGQIDENTNIELIYEVGNNTYIKVIFALVIIASIGIIYYLYRKKSLKE